MNGQHGFPPASLDTPANAGGGSVLANPPASILNAPDARHVGVPAWIRYGLQVGFGLTMAVLFGSAIVAGLLGTL